MANISKWNPYDELQRMREDLARFFAPFGSALSEGMALGNWSPLVDVRETPGEFVVSAEVPGVDPGDLEVTISEDSLTLRGHVGEKHEQNQSGFQRVERRYGAFERRIPFPSSVLHEQGFAECRNGVLEIRVPKADPAKGRVTRLQINAGAPGGAEQDRRLGEQPPLQQ